MAKIYRSLPGSIEWEPLTKAGGLLFLRDGTSGSDLMFLRLVDIDKQEQSKQADFDVLWEHELYLNFDYHKEKPYFYSFESDVRSRQKLGMNRQQS